MRKKNANDQVAIGFGFASDCEREDSANLQDQSRNGQKPVFFRYSGEKCSPKTSCSHVLE